MDPEKGQLLARDGSEQHAAADDVGVAHSTHSDSSRMSPHTHADSEKITAATR